MRRIFTGPAVLVAACALAPLPAFADDGNRQRDEDVLFHSAEGEPPAEEAPADDEDEIVLDEDEMEAAPDTPPDGGAGGEAGGGLDFLDEGGEGAETPGPEAAATADGAVAPEIDEDEQRKQDEQNITVVQRQAFLNVYKNEDGKTIRRFDLQPQVGLSVNDPFVRHYAVGAEFNFWLSNRMALGITGTGFFGAKTPAYDRIRFQNGLLLTANRNLWQASANFLYEPFYGKIAVFNRLLMHWEAYTQIGAGIIHTRVIPRFEALHDPFDNFNPQGNFAIGARFYASGLDFMSFNFGVRTFIFPDKFEPPNRGPATSGGAGESVDNPALDDADAAKDAAETRISFSSIVMFGVSFYLPPTFRYSTRR